MENQRRVVRFMPYELMRDWGIERIVASTSHYVGKILLMKAGTKGGLQWHRQKDETFYLYSGQAIVRMDDGMGLTSREMWPGDSYHIPPGAVHQVEAVEACVFFETSTPHMNDRVRAEHNYDLPAAGGLPTTPSA